MLQKCWDAAKKHSNEVVAFKASARLQVRSILHILKLLGIEAKFYDELHVAVGSSPQAVNAAAASGSQGVISTTEAADPMFLAKLKGLDLKVGNVVTHKDHPHKLWTITKVQQAGLQITYKHPVASFEEKLEVNGKSAIACVKMSKAKVPKLLGKHMMEQAFATTRCQVEKDKRMVYMELLGRYSKKDVGSNSIKKKFKKGDLTLVPMSRLFAKKKFKKGDLTLAPITSQ